MRYRPLGRSGLMVSEISLGSWVTFGAQVGQDDTQQIMHAAYDAGINYFDGAEIYANGAAEEAMGKVFKQARWPRDTLIISTKVLRIGPKPTQGGLSRKHMIEAVDAALGRMGVDYVDLCFCHAPDGVTPMDEIVHTMNGLIQRGKVLYWGTSNFKPFQVQELYTVAERDHLVGPTMEQTLYSMLDRLFVDRDFKPIYERYGLGTTVFSPLAQGVLTGKYNEGVPPESRFGQDQGDSRRKNKFLDEATLNKVRQLTSIANNELDCSMAQLALAWCLRNTYVSTVLTGASRPEQIRDNVQAVDVVDKFDDEIMQGIEDILDNHPERHP